MPTPPIKYPSPGRLLKSGASLRQLDERTRKAAQLTGGNGIMVINDQGGQHIVPTGLPGFWVMIARDSGQGASAFPTSVPDYCYSGHKLFIDKSLNITVDARRYWDKQKFPLVEMAKNPDVPDGAIAYAVPAPDGTHYQFLWIGDALSEFDPGCMKCCCCCAPCKDGVVLTFPSFGSSCTTGTITGFPAMFLYPDGNCFRCDGESPWIVADGHGGFVSYGHIDLEVTLCCPSKTACPILTIRGTYTINADGATALGAVAGTYAMCVGPISFDSVTGCHILDNDESGGPATWDGSVSQSALNDCDQNNWECDCYTTFGGAITAKCSCDALCPRSGIPSTFTVILDDSAGTISGGDTAIGVLTGVMARTNYPGTNYACYRPWTADLTTPSGCVIHILMECAEGGTIAVTFTVTGDAGCVSTLTTILATDYTGGGGLTQVGLTCKPFCYHLRGNGGIGAGHLKFGSC